MKTFLSVFLTAVLPNPALGADLCQDLIKEIRSRPSILSGTESATEGLKQDPAFLAEERHDNADEEIFSVPSVKTFAVVFSGGADRCRGINFYRTGKPKLQLPDPPVPDQHDLLEGNACASGVKDYQFAFGTIHKVPAFLFSQSDMVDFSESISVAELSGLSWRKGCRADVTFEAIFQPPRAFVASDSGFEKGSWSKIATEIALAHGTTLKNSGFHFGGALPEESKAAAETLLGIVKKDWLMKLPLFGSIDKDAANFNTNGSGGMSFHTVVLNNHPYVFEIGHHIGMRDSAFAPMGMILFDGKGDKAVPVASAFIDVKRGPLKSVKIN